MGVIVFSFIICIIIAYLLGSINFAIIMTKLFKKTDIRNAGSGNAGFTNVLRTVGKLPAIITLIGDFSKGILSVLILRFVFALLGYQLNPSADYIVCLAALSGHVYPIFYKFKGGKGILVSFGAVMILSPVSGLICLLGFLITLIVSKYVSLGSLIAAVLFPLAILFLSAVSDLHLPIEWLMAMPISIFIIFMHRQNIVRLVNHTENKISVKKKD